METYSTAQKQRLIELNADGAIINQKFETVEERNAFFKKAEKRLIKENKEKLNKFIEEERLPLTLSIEDSLEKWLIQKEAFSRVATPVIISADKVRKMNIDHDNHLREQIFWLDGRKCLRPMLAPNLYEVMRDMYRVTRRPIRIFEAGSCFRKESQGARHMNEFTMLNLVELAGVKNGEQMERLEVLARGAMEALEIEDYKLVRETSGVYIETLDIEVDGVEIASGAYGPHPLDANWGIFEPWVGIGFGLERIAMVKGGYQTIKHIGKSIAYVNGISLKL
ncbi:pyrrolysine--tRNA(Pyl) ligase large subunit [bacterium 210820-DFI.6.37]|nr:pyrrolysine--tRNA(Pyl) ligase large subunit [bacterium 210820-DFI.6.37]